MDFASDGLALIDPDWRVAYLNPAASRILGYDLRDIVGRNLWKLLPDAVDTWFSERLYKAASTLEATRFRVNYGPLGGWFELSVFPAPDGLTVFFRNIEDELAAEVERERLVESLELALERSHHLQTITERLADTITVREVAQTVLKYTRAALGTLYAGLALVDERREFLEFEEQHALPRAIHENWGRVPLSTDAPVTAAGLVRDWRLEPEANGSRTLHVDLTGPTDERLVVNLECVPRRTPTRRPHLRFPRFATPGATRLPDSTFYALRPNKIEVDDLNRSGVIDLTPDEFLNQFGGIADLKLAPNTPGLVEFVLFLLVLLLTCVGSPRLPTRSRTAAPSRAAGSRTLRGV